MTKREYTEEEKEEFEQKLVAFEVEYNERRKNATGWEKERFDRQEIYSENLVKYMKGEGYFQQLDKSHLTNLTYNERLAAAEQLNGCAFKHAKPSKEQYVTREKLSQVAIVMNCDGRYIFSRLGACIGLLFFLVGCGIIPFGLLFAFNVIGLETGYFYNRWLQMLLGLFAAGPLQYILFKTWQKVDHWDYVLFDRHTGLVRFPRRLWRRPIYVPIDDVELCKGPDLKTARGSGSMPTGSLVLTKYPKRRWLQPSYTLLGGMRQERWADINLFMDSSQEIDPSMYKAIEPYFAKNQTIFGTPYHDELRKYFDENDKQINRSELW